MHEALVHSRTDMMSRPMLRNTRCSAHLILAVGLVHQRANLMVGNGLRMRFRGRGNLRRSI